MKELKILFQLNSAYRVNSFLYHLRSIPIAKDYVDDWMNISDIFKSIVMIFVGIKEMITLFLTKILYLLILVVLPLMAVQTLSLENALGQIFLCLTWIGGFMNTFLFNPTKDRYYAIILMRMNAKRCVLSEYFYACARIIAGYLPIMLIAGSWFDLPLGLLLSLPFLQIAVKNIFNACTLIFYQYTGKVRNENAVNQPLMWGAAFLLLGMAYVPLFFNWTLNVNVYWIIFVISMILGVLAGIYLIRFEDYAAIYKQLLKPDHVIFDAKSYSQNALKQNAAKQIQYNEIKTNKTGVAYFNEIFTKRHASILTRSAKRIALGVVLIGAICAAVLIFVPELKDEAQRLILNGVPFFLFVMYYLNRGQQITQSMFINCDNAMLHYRFYRQPKFLLALFTQRLRTLVMINLLPALCIAFCLAGLLAISGGGSWFDYGLIAMTILAMSIFYSVHYLVLYYLLQPFNEQVEMKSIAYQAVIIITYIVAYQFLSLPMSLSVFGLSMVVFTMIYVLIALALVYTQAPKTFHIK